MKNEKGEKIFILNMRKDPSQPWKTIMDVSDINRIGAENHQVVTLADFEQFIAERKPDAVMFDYHDCPRRAVTVEKAMPHIRKLIRDYQKHPEYV